MENNQVGMSDIHSLLILLDNLTIIFLDNLTSAATILFLYINLTFIKKLIDIYV